MQSTQKRHSPSTVKPLVLMTLFVREPFLKSLARFYNTMQNAFQESTFTFRVER